MRLVVMLAGLLVMDPALKVMVVAKENAAAHAFAKHIESLQLPPSLEDKFGRLVGVTELEKGLASKTRLDVPPPSSTWQLDCTAANMAGGSHLHNQAEAWIWPSMMRASSRGT